MDKDIVLREPNRCISCAYLCYLEAYKHREVLESSRKAIIRKNLAQNLYSSLRCYKNHLSDMYNSFSPNNAEEAAGKVIQSTCPHSGWRLHQDGIDSEKAYQHEQQRKNFRWTKTGAIIAIISIIATLTVLALTIYNIFFK